LKKLEEKANATDLEDLKKSFETEKAEMQKEFDALSAKLKTIQDIPGNNGQEGSVTKMFKDRIEGKEYDKSKFYEKHEIKGVDFAKEFVRKDPALMTTANVKPNVVGGFSPLFGNYIDTEIGHTPQPENIMLP